MFSRKSTRRTSEVTGFSRRRLTVESLECRTLFSVSEPNNTRETAVFVPDIYLENQYFASDAVSSTGDGDDYFGFYNLYGPSHLYAALYGLSADADLYVYQGDNLIASSLQSSNLSEHLQIDLAPFQYYYVRVFGYSGSTNYNLLLQNDYAGSGLATARDMGKAWGQGSSQFWAYDKIFNNEYLDYRDNVDYVKFEMEAAGNVSVRRLRPQTDLVTTTQLLDASGNVLATASDSDGAQNIDRFSLPRGTYYVRFAQFSGAGDYQFRVVADYAGDFTGAARDLGELQGTSRRLYDMVGGPFSPSVTYEDAIDLYKFTFNQTAPLDVELAIPSSFSQPTFDANLHIARDSDGNGFISTSEYVVSSRNSGNERISTTLGAGTYYVVVEQNGAYTSYQLDLDSDFDAVPGDPAAYWNMSQAPDMGILTGASGRVGGFGISAGDFNDFYRLEMAAAGRLNVAAFVNPFWSRETQQPMLGIIRDANGNQRYDGGEEIQPYTFDGRLQADLPAGTYYIQAAGTGVQADYNLSLVADYAGNTPVAARLMDPVVGPNPAPQVFQDYIEQDFGSDNDVDDFYRFNLSGQYQVTIDTTGIDGEDLSLTLIRDVNGNGMVDPEDILHTSDNLNSPYESIASTLEAGEYFVQIHGINGGTNYGLNFAASGIGVVPEDLNGDGAVDAADAAMMFGAWGQVGNGLPADITGDGTVDAADAGQLFAHWTGDAAPLQHLFSNWHARRSNPPQTQDEGLLAYLLEN